MAVSDHVIADRFSSNSTRRCFFGSLLLFYNPFQTAFGNIFSAVHNGPESHIPRLFAFFSPQCCKQELKTHEIEMKDMLLTNRHGYEPSQTPISHTLLSHCATHMAP